MTSLLFCAGLAPVAAILCLFIVVRDRHQRMKRASTSKSVKFHSPVAPPRRLLSFGVLGIFVTFIIPCLALEAQTPAPTTTQGEHPNSMLISSWQQTDSLAASSSSLFSSSSDSIIPVTATRAMDEDAVRQPPPRSRYGRPRYSDSHHNADGSNKYTFVAGGGMTIPTSTTHADLKPSYNIQGGFGRNFNQEFGVIAQIDWANFGLQTNTLNTLLSTYNSLGAVDQNGNPLTQLGGTSHAWSLTLNPTYNIVQGETKGLYVIAGAGFYHKTANFTIPGVGTYCDLYYGCYQYQANQTIDKYTSNAFGVNGGVGFTYKMSRFSAGRLFAEARYVFVANQPRPYSLGSATSSYFNVFPQNSARTTFIPITVGIRF